ncbi:low molecular weight protein arginine phosphatase [Miniphocaeibacter halophilus]|uniref:Low molecular weight protein arginine phosphatase n=1 Tax=Miniphocaeibacter halophilus TaxID=2931922 RepID=A0AC61MPI8_9FIRM|nr:low molecular weight protein arginine phosphatase [Miniphocaeibacter halophilus]QQK07419.1 low molecular weight protein arginine phosphatase [Miniphocaeibacter halophilus]
MNVLFVCTGNTCRSPMAEYIFNDLSKRKGLSHRAKSSGIAASGDYASKNAILSMADIGIDLTRHISTQVSKEKIDWADIVLVMGRSHLDILKHYFPDEDKIFLLKDFAEGKQGEITDPYGSEKFIYDNTRDEIINLIEKFIINL